MYPTADLFSTLRLKGFLGSDRVWLADVSEDACNVVLRLILILHVQGVSTFVRELRWSSPQTDLAGWSGTAYQCGREWFNKWFDIGKRQQIKPCCNELIAGIQETLIKQVGWNFHPVVSRGTPRRIWLRIFHCVIVKYFKGHLRNRTLMVSYLGLPVKYSSSSSRPVSLKPTWEDVKNWTENYLTPLSSSFSFPRRTLMEINL